MNIVYFLKLNTENMPNRTVRKKLCSKKAKEIVETAAFEFSGKKPCDLHFEMKENGKPFLPNLPDFHFNISHSENAVAVVISDREVGIDCEKIRTADMRIAKRRFTEKEYAYINADSSESDLCFFEIWTKKEAFLKQSGNGITVPLNSFDVTCDALKNRFFTIEKNGFMISVCSELPLTEFIFKDISPKI